MNHSRLANWVNIWVEHLPGQTQTGKSNHHIRPGPEVIKLFSCSIELSMKFFQLINVKMPTIVGILTYMNRKNSILGFSEYEKS